MREPTKNETIGDLNCQKGNLSCISIVKSALALVGEETINKNEDLLTLKQSLM